MEKYILFSLRSQDGVRLDSKKCLECKTIGEANDRIANPKNDDIGSVWLIFKNEGEGNRWEFVKAKPFQNRS